MHTAHRFTYGASEDGWSEWVRVIRATNGIRPGTFGAPIERGEWWAGGNFELYPEARVILPGEGRADDEGVLIVPLTDEVAEALSAAVHEVSGG